MAEHPRQAGIAALQRIGWVTKRQTGSHRVLSRDGWPDVVFAFHDQVDMSTYSLQVTYRHGKPFAAYLYLAHSPGMKSVRTERVSEEVLIDYAADETPLGIEIVSPSDVSMDDIHAAFDRLGLTRPEPADLSPLRAA